VLDGHDLVLTFVDREASLVEISGMLERAMYDMIIEGSAAVDEVVERSVILRDGVRWKDFGVLFDVNPNLDLTKVQTTDLEFLAHTLGIEAVRSYLAGEIIRVLRAEGIEVTRRHIDIVVDCMVNSGETQPIRYGSLDINEAVLLKASFQQASDTLGKAASARCIDCVMDVSAEMIMGVLPAVGAGAVRLIHERNEVVDGTSFEPLIMAMEEVEVEVYAGSPVYVPASPAYYEQEYCPVLFIEPDLSLN
jgi:hypothetical protein